MIADITGMPSKDAKALPDAAKTLFMDTYNEDFGWRCSEAHALKAAWRAVDAAFVQGEDGTWNQR